MGLFHSRNVDGIERLEMRLSELEARQARLERTLARQRKINEALLEIMEHGGWMELQGAVDKALAIE